MILSTLLAQQNFSSEGFEYLVNGSMIRNTQIVYTSAMGEWFYVAIMVFMLLMVYIRYQNFGAVVFVGVLGVASFWALPDVAHPILYILSALALGLLLYSFFGKPNSPYA